MSKIEILLINLRKLRDLRIANTWQNIARENQKMPSCNWFGWLIMAGRGFGKTRTGAETVKQLILTKNYKRICLIAETYDDARKIMIEGESGLLKIHAEHEKPKHYPSKRQLIWKNGAVATYYSAENYEALRGPQFDLAWIDEFAKFDTAREVWDQLMFCLRLGEPKVIITTTPRSKPILHELANRSDIVVTTGSTFDNKKNLPQQFLSILQNQYDNTDLGNQEINGQLLSDDAIGLWKPENIQYGYATSTPETIIAIDPATEYGPNNNETGIIVAGKNDGKYYIIEDHSGIMNPNYWAELVYELYKKHNAKKIIVESNQGGQILMNMLKNLHKAPWIAVKAKESKYARALPIACLYQKKLVYHTKKFTKLEEQMINFHSSNADDRVDALVWALHGLTNSEQRMNVW